MGLEHFCSLNILAYTTFKPKELISTSSNSHKIIRIYNTHTHDYSILSWFEKTLCIYKESCV